MGDFTALLGDLARTCQELEQIKAQQTKDHERVSRSFEKTLLSILKQEQSILNHVEEEHRRLRDQLTSIQKDNELALQKGVCEINGMVQKICNVSSQLKQALVTPKNNELVIRQIQGTLSNVFSKKNGINISLRKVHFTPRPLQTTILGGIRCEEQVLGFSIPCLNKKIESHWCKRTTNKPVLLSDETPPWEDKSHHPEGCAGDGEDDSDQESESTTTNQSAVDLKKQHDDRRRNLSPRDPAVMEADSAALSPQVATKIWITDSKNIKMPQGTRDMVESGDPTNKPYNQHVIHEESRGNPRKETFPQPESSTKRQPRPQGSGTKKETMTMLESDILSNLQETKDQNETKAKTMCEEVRHDGVFLNEHDSLFRATAAYVCEDESDSSEDTMENVETGGVRDAKACRQLAIRDSRVPSAKKQNDGDQETRWNSLDSDNQPNKSGETSRVSYLNKHNLESATQVAPHTPVSGIDYMRMSDETSDSLSGDFLTVPPRSCSPSESVKSSYTFIIEAPKKKQTEAKSGTFSRSSNPINRESRKRPPVIAPAAEKSKSKQQTVALPEGRQRPGPKMRNQRLQGNWKPVPRSSSMPYIERLSRPNTAPPRSTRPMSAKERRDSGSSSSSTWSITRSVAASTPSSALREIRVRVKSAQYSRKPPKTSQERPKCLSKSEPNLIDSTQDVGGDGLTKLVRQFSKFGSGRAELNLPHGIWATSTGSIYIVDYGNRRLQVMDTRGKVLQQFALEAKNYFDVAVSNRGLVALTNSSDRSVDVYSKHGRLLQVLSRNWGAPRGITANYKDEFIVADMKLGAICALTLDPTTGRQKESVVVPGFNKPYLVGSNRQGLLAVSERGLDGGCCVKVLGEDWQLLKVLGLKSSPGPALSNPWGVCVDSEGGVLVADWAQTHCIVYYPPTTPARVIVSGGLSSPRGLASWQDGLVVVADSMHSCIKLYQYQEPQE